MTDAPTQQNNISITIRPTQEEFNDIHKKEIINDLITYFKTKNILYIISLEKGKLKIVNHYQIGISTIVHIDTIRRNVNRIFKPLLTPKTLKIGIWKKVKLHKDLKGLTGYCQKESDVYNSNMTKEYRLQALKYYISLSKKTKHPKKENIYDSNMFIILEKSGLKILYYPIKY